MPAGAYLRAETLCYSLNNNEIPLVTISADDTPSNPIVVSTRYYLIIFHCQKLDYLYILKIFMFPIMFRLIVLKKKKTTT